jgi:hypothetical protein
MNRPTVNFSEMTPDERQAWADFTLHEISRHMEDVNRGTAELMIIKNKYKITPRNVFVGTWIEVK